MWRKSILLGVVLGAIVFAVGYGRVLLFRLFLRSILVCLGTVLTVIAARKSINVFVQSSDTGVSQQAPDVNLGSIDANEEESEQESAEEFDPSDLPDSPEEVSEFEDELDDESDIEDLANMVSDTMKEDQ